MTTLPAFDGKIAPNPHLVGAKQAYLPSTLIENHASFLMWLDDARLACVWFAGSREARPDASIYFCTYDLTAGQWGEPVKVSTDSQRSEQNPVLHRLPDGRLWLLYTAQEFGAQDTAIIKQQFSADEGQTWSEPEVFAAPPQAFLRQPIVEQGDKWLLPIFICQMLPGRAWHGDADYSGVLVSADQGKTWEFEPVPESIGAVHMNIVPLRSAQGVKLIALYRSRWGDYVYRSEYDGAWSQPQPTNVRNNNSSIQATAVEIAGREAIVLVCNPLGPELGSHLGDRTEFHNAHKRVAPGQIQPLERHASGGPRRLPLTVLVSVDDGVSFTPICDLETDDSISPALAQTEGRKKDEMSYPAIVATAAGDLHITYSYARRTIKHQILPHDLVVQLTQAAGI